MRRSSQVKMPQMLGTETLEPTLTKADLLVMRKKYRKVKQVQVKVQGKRPQVYSADDIDCLCGLTGTVTFLR